MAHRSRIPHQVFRSGALRLGPVVTVIRASGTEVRSPTHIHAQTAAPPF
jgi:hypothetical protein